MKKLFYKHETMFCIGLIVLYVALNSFSVQSFGTASIYSVLINTALSAFLIVLMLSLGKTKYYGLTSVKNKKDYLYFLPLLLLSTVNLWSGVNLNTPAGEAVLHILTMANVGFIEEIVFRGFLFRMMEKTNVKVAIFVNALTFGFGHIVNLFNGADLVPTLLQICYVCAIGYLFVTIFYRCSSIVPCIITHIAVNATSVFAAQNTAMSYVTAVVTVFVSVGYAMFINKKQCANNTEDKA